MRLATHLARLEGHHIQNWAVGREEHVECCAQVTLLDLCRWYVSHIECLVGRDGLDFRRYTGAWRWTFWWCCNFRHFVYCVSGMFNMLEKILAIAGCNEWIEGVVIQGVVWKL